MEAATHETVTTATTTAGMGTAATIETGGVGNDGDVMDDVGGGGDVNDDRRLFLFRYSLRSFAANGGVMIVHMFLLRVATADFTAAVLSSSS